ncbi:MAG TPA: polysaccharide deacetylase family protein [Thermoanaerobaculia bacterium]|nr:polysaccharide deacetylase family protein [Thermoanaerobaculia bacterium]
MRGALTLCFAFLSLAVHAGTLQERLGYPASAKLLIVHADDLGMAHTVNAASIRALESGLVNSASIMVPCPWLPEIVQYAKSHPQADLGLHLTLTSEWTSFRWGPVLPETEVPTLLDAAGYLHLTESEAAKRIDPREAEAEIRAQIARARAAGIVPTHLDSHMGTLYQTKELFQVLMRVAREEKLPARISRAHARIPFIAETLLPSDIVIDHIISIGSDISAGAWEAWYDEAIRNLKPGVSEVIVHLAYDDLEMRGAAVNHPHWGSQWRQRDFDYFTSDHFRAVLRENDIVLITWRDLSRLLQKEHSVPSAAAGR